MAPAELAGEDLTVVELRQQLEVWKKMFLMMQKSVEREREERNMMLAEISLVRGVPAVAPPRRWALLACLSKPASTDDTRARSSPR